MIFWINFKSVFLLCSFYLKFERFELFIEHSIAECEFLIPFKLVVHVKFFFQFEEKVVLSLSCDFLDFINWYISWFFHDDDIIWFCFLIISKEFDVISSFKYWINSLSIWKVIWLLKDKNSFLCEMINWNETSGILKERSIVKFNNLLIAFHYHIMNLEWISSYTNILLINDKSIVKIREFNIAWSETTHEEVWK